MDVLRRNAASVDPDLYLQRAIRYVGCQDNLASLGFLLLILLLSIASLILFTQRLRQDD